MDDTELVDRAVEHERRLLDPTVRARPDLVGSALAPDFVEIGQTGRRWNREALIEALAHAPGVSIATPVMTGRVIGPNLVLLEYRTEGDHGAVHRSSVWRLDHNRWQILFHQATRVIDAT